MFANRLLVSRWLIINTFVVTFSLKYRVFYRFNRLWLACGSGDITFYICKDATNSRFVYNSSGFRGTCILPLRSLICCPCNEFLQRISARCIDYAAVDQLESIEQNSMQISLKVDLVKNKMISLHQKYLSVIVSKDQARSTDRGRRIPSKFSAFFLYQIRL